MKELRELIKEVTKDITKTNSIVTKSSNSAEKLVRKINIFINNTWLIMVILVIYGLIL